MLGADAILISGPETTCVVVFKRRQIRRVNFANQCRNSILFYSSSFCLYSFHRFELPGGKILLKNEENETLLPPIKGKLRRSSGFTTSLATNLDQLQESGGVHNPTALFNLLTKKCPQFGGGDQHDSHELLRHLLESVKYVIAWVNLHSPKNSYYITKLLHFISFM